jgi:hypothetical protein
MASSGLTNTSKATSDDIDDTYKLTHRDGNLTRGCPHQKKTREGEFFADAKFKVSGYF